MEINNPMYLAEALETCPKDSEYREQVELAAKVLALSFGHFHVALHAKGGNILEAHATLPDDVMVGDFKFKKIPDYIMENTLLGTKRYFAIYKEADRSAIYCNRFIVLTRDQFK